MWKEFVSPEKKLEIISPKENKKNGTDTYLNGISILPSIKED